jgi:endonuclease YncB( thermonuclease family)
MAWRYGVGLLLLMLMLALPARSQPQTELVSWTGVVTYVADGDTVHVRPVEGGAVHKIRLVGMDAPEICQVGGEIARKALNERIHQRVVTVSAQGVDIYGRDLALIYLDQEDVGRWLVQRGHAWSSRYRHHTGPYDQEEENAKLLGRGLFAEMPAEHPRDFRRRHGRCPYGR